MGTKLGDVFVALGLESRDYDRGIKDAERKASLFAKTVNGFFERIGQRGFDALANGLRNVFVNVFSFFNEAANGASDLNEAINKTNVVFGQSAKAIVQWAKTADTALGQTTTGALAAAAGFGNLFTSLGIARDEAARMSVEFVELASDIASLNNIDPEEALEKLRAGLVGETEPLRTVGVFLNETVVQAKAAELGFGALGGKLTEQEKILARYALILDQTANAQGDFARTSTEAANAQRILTAQFSNLQTTFGQAILPIKTAVLNGLSQIITAVQPYGQQIIANLARGLAAGVAYITPALMQLRAMFVRWLRPGSPPRLLPELVVWGAQAASEWISGWSKADFSGLEQLGSAVEGILRSFVASGKIGETDLVSRVLGTRDSIRKAISEFARFGSVSEKTIAAIARNAGPAGTAVADLVRAYFNLARASDAVRKAQDELNAVTEKYDALLNPLNDSLDAVRAQQNRLANQKRLIDARNTLANFEATEAEKQAARLEIEQITLEEQISAVEQRKKAEEDAAQANLDGATEAEQAAQSQYDIAQAVLQQQVQTNNLLGEELALQQRLQQEREAAAQQAQSEAEALRQAMLQYQLGLTDTQGKIKLLYADLANTPKNTPEYFQKLGEIHALEQQAAEEARRTEEQLHDAQLQYQLALADTAGKIAILRGELDKAQPGSLKFFDLMTQIVGLQKQLQGESGAGAPGLPEPPPLEAGTGILGDLIAPETKQAIDELSDSIGVLFDQLTGSNDAINSQLPESMQAIGGSTSNGLTDFIADLQGAFEALKNISVSLQEINEFFSPTQPDTSGWKLFSDLLEGIAKIVKGDLSPLFTFQTTGGGLLGLLGFEEGQEIDLRDVLQWIPFYNTVKEALQSVRDLLPGSEPKDTSSPLYNLAAVGAAIFTNIIDGAQAKWDELFPWWAQAWQMVRDLLPGSEPKDSGSPLANLGKSGEAILNNIWEGLKTVWALLLPWWSGDSGILHQFPERVADFFQPLADAGTALFTAFWDAIELVWTDIGNWWSGEEGVLKSFATSITDLVTDFYTAGESLLDSLWDGLKDKWTEISNWWSGPSGAWSTFRNTLPFSEPKDPSSPLRGLGDSGEALIGNIQAGMDRAQLTIGNSLGEFDPQALGGNTTNATTNQLGGITIQVYGAANPQETADAVTNQLQRTLRAAGYMT